MLIKIKYLLQIYFLFIALTFALSSSYYLSGGTANVGLFPELYFLKHATLVLLVLIGVYIMIIKKLHKISIVFIFIIPYIFYLWIDYGIVFAQFVLFLIAASLLSYIYDTKYFLKISFILCYFLAIISVPIIDFVFNEGNFIYNSFYGRERLLLGYFHPKEAGIMFVIFFIMVALSNKFKNLFQKLFFYTLSLSVLYFIQSRNSLLFLINFIILNFLIRKIGLRMALFTYFLIYILIPLMLLAVFFNELDLITSHRLSLWRDGLEFNLVGRIFEFSNKPHYELFQSKFHIDNFYFEFLIEAGMIAFLFLMLCLIYIGYKIRNTQLNGYRMISFYISFLIFCFFDAGMFSTGNFMNIFAWSVIIFLIREKRSLNANNLR